MISAMSKSHSLSVVFGLAVAFSAIGCGSNHRDSLSETQVVNATIAALGDAAMSEESFSSVFASGSAPSTREDYATCNYEVIGDPSISGAEATAEVQVTTGFADSSQGDRAKGSDNKEVRKVTWTLAKEGEEWKIKDAPLQ